MRAKSRVPQIRFKEFNGEWEEKKLGDIGSIGMNKRIFKYQTSLKGDIPFYKIGTFGGQADAFISKELFKEYKSKYPYPEKGDLLISASGSIGRIVEYTGRDEYFQDSNIVWLIHSNQISNLFLKQFYTVVKWSGLEGSTIKRLYNKNILETYIKLPKKNEQIKIGNYFQNLDHLIEQKEKKHQKLKQLKKAMLEKMFPKEGKNTPEIRFKGFSGEWEKKKLGDFVNLTHGDGDWILSKDITNNGKYKIVQLGNIGFGKYIEKDLKMVSLKTFKILNGTPIKKGDLLINRMVDGNVNSCIFKYDGNYITSVDVCWIRENEYFNNYFMMSFLTISESQNSLLSLSSGSGRIRISKRNLFEKFNFLLPIFEEQTKIGNYFQKLDKLIELQSQEIEKLKNIKKASLEKMFV